MNQSSVNDYSINAKKAAKDFAMTEVNWSAPRGELLVLFRNNKELGKKMLEIRNRYVSVLGR